MNDPVFAPGKWTSFSVEPGVVDPGSDADVSSVGAPGSSAGPSSSQSAGAGPVKGPIKLPVKSALLAIHGTYVDPRKPGQVQHLPPHRWQLYNVADWDLVMSGTKSRNGISVVFDHVDTTKSKLNAPDPRWFLLLLPIVPKRTIAELMSANEVWLDLDRKAWVLVDHAEDMEKRRLIRFPIWSSLRKAASGGFKVSPAGTSFSTTGILTTAELRNMRGTIGKPWEIQIDFGWLGTFLRFSYYDTSTLSVKAVPPGLLVEALGIKTGLNGTLKSPGPLRVGGGTSIDDNTVYVLHERSAADSTDVEFQFTCRPFSRTFVDYAAKPPKPGNDDRLKATVNSKFTDDPLKGYTLPQIWHSLGMGATVLAGPKKWPLLRSHTSTFADPVVFHLDDTILVDNTTGPVTLLGGARVALFDRQLAFRGPFDPVVVPWWNGALSENYLRGEDVIFTPGQPWLKLTFIIEHEGEFFVLRQDRVDGTPGFDACVGARAAIARAPDKPIGEFLNGFPSLGGDGHAQLHLITDAYPGPFDVNSEGAFLAAHPDARICHLLVYVSVSVTADPTDPTVTSLDVNAIFGGLLDAAERWDQGHPSSGSSGKKDYVAVPAAGVKSGTRVVKLRHYFGPRADGKQVMSIQARNQPTPTLGTRSFTSNGALILFEPKARLGNESMDKADHVALPWFTLAHELGHVLGLPDDYGEPLDLGSRGTGLGGPFPIRFGQAHEAYPFNSDAFAMMRGNKLPRLRYRWHLVDFLNNGAKAQLPEGPYVSAYSTFKGGMTYAIPQGNTNGPRDVVATQRMTSNRADLVLFRLGDDEGYVEHIFERPATTSTAAGAWLNGVLVLKTKLWFNFFASATGDFPGDVERWNVVQAFQLKWYSRSLLQPRTRLFLDGPSTIALSRIAIMFEPRLEFGPVPNPKSGFAPPNVTEADADVIVDVVFQATAGTLFVPKVPLPAKGSGPDRVVIGSADVGLSLMRFVIGQPMLAPGATQNNGALAASELTELAQRVVSMAGAPAGTIYVVKDLP